MAVPVSRLLPLAAFILGVACVGCGGEEKLYDISGTITYQGQPVAKGLIFFDPVDGGPQGFANIENGRYDTALAQQGRGIRGGKYNVRINGFDGQVGPDAPFGNALFPEHIFPVELPPQNQTFNYEVPTNPTKRR
ncbi:MAG: hypothetical protein RMJ56_03660 [Gemmataceae bacterium]|nr:hypothetical protein [Gemmata sp.]MDW8196685.1 hypothetical protein [Gemmataceae bacterium]